MEWGTQQCVMTLDIKKPSATISLKLQDIVLTQWTNTTNFGIFCVCHPMNQTQEDIMNLVSTFYDQSQQLDTLVALIKQVDQISLRLLDWLVTSFARDKNLLTSPSSESCIYEKYKRVLSKYKRRNFDPFRRAKRRVEGVSVAYDVTFVYNGAQLRTTVGQLNFVKWCVESEVYHFAVTHKVEIEDTMLCGQNKTKKRKLKNIQPVTNITNGNYTVSFA